MNNTQNYWEQNGKYQTEYNEMDKFIPQRGRAHLPHIELVRCAARLYWDLYNNFAMNWGENHQGFLNRLSMVPGTESMRATIETKLEEAWGDDDCGCWDKWDCEECDGSGQRPGDGLDGGEFDELAPIYEQLTNLTIEYAWGIHQQTNLPQLQETK